MNYYSSINFNNLLSVAKKINIIDNLKPINQIEEKNKFFSSNYDYNPQFVYPEVNNNRYLDILKKFEFKDNEYSSLLKLRIEELINQIKLLHSINNNSKFTDLSILLYGKPNKGMLKVAHNILKNKIKVPNTKQTKFISLKNIIESFEKNIINYGLNTKITITNNDDNTIYASRYKNEINVPKNYKKENMDFNGTIMHELTHLIRQENSKMQHIDILELYTANYIKTDEGLATLVGYANREHKLLTIPSLYYVAIDYAIKNDFINTYKYILGLVKNEEKAWNYTLRVKRGIANTSLPGAFTKDLYLEWAIVVGREILKNPSILLYIYNGKASTQELLTLTKPNNIYKKFLTISQIKNIFKINKINY